MKGFRQRGNTIEIYFNWLNQKHFIKVNSIEQGIQLRQQILTHLQQGTLTQEIIDNLVNPITFEQVVTKYLKYNQANSQTKHTYKNILQHHWSELYPYPIETITTEQILDIIIEKELSNKYINQILIPLRGVFDVAVMLKYIQSNPVQIKNRKIQLELPDPFTKNEMETILAWLKDNSHQTCYLFYEISFWTGLRPSELLALTWQDISEDSIYVHKSKVRGIEKSTTKTKVSRNVLLNPRSKHAIEQLDKGHEYLIVTPKEHKPYSSNTHLKSYFIQAMKSNHIRLRPSYNTRHTYATMLLMSGVNPSFVANQLGHSLVMLNTRYARWLNSHLDKLEIAKLNW